MSYDLYFRARSSSPPSMNHMRTWFEGRARYRFHGTADGGQAAYENEATGIHFQFDFEAVDHEPDAPPVLPIAFNMNYLRPHVFALEAEPEVAAFVRHFDLGVEDPQGAIPGTDYDTAGFLRGWDEGNRAACRLSFAGDDDAPWTLPSADIARTWRWNFAVNALAERMEAQLLACFVPTILLLRSDLAPRRVLRAVVWDGTCGILLPEVDLVVCRGGEDRLNGIEMQDLTALLPPSNDWPDPPARMLPKEQLGDTLPARMKSLFRPFQATRLEPSQVLDAEFVASSGEA
ncbi:hypothetical protein LVJ94_49780 [Pendulispora rubella]|uniref:Uncharacterized protein n=1 Tax=Pendulispora rubella TaxID=2741070 RepID=A0ABZ2L226_9BACT